MENKVDALEAGVMYATQIWVKKTNTKKHCCWEVTSYHEEGYDKKGNEEKI